MSKSHIHDLPGDRAFYIVCTVVLAILLLIVAYPIYFVLIASISDVTLVNTGKVLLYPRGLQLLGYQRVLTNARILTGYRNTMFYTIAATLLNLTMTMTAGYALSVKVPGRNFFSLMITFTMFFGGGLIPYYFVIRGLGILNTVWVMILPGAVSAYNLIITRTFLNSNIPHELYEAASIDGCNRLQFFVKVVVPLSGTLIAVLTLLYAVGHWNDYFNALMFLTKRTLHPLQLVLREILIENSVSADDMDGEAAAALMNMKETLKYALIVVSSLPMMILYPLVQKHFVKGVMIGSVKG